MKALTKAGIGVENRLDKHLGHVLSMDMVQSLQAKIGQVHCLSMHQRLKDLRILIACGIHRHMPLAHNVPGVHDGTREPGSSIFPLQVFRHFQLFTSIVTDGRTVLPLRIGHHCGLAMDPGASTAQKVRDLPPQSICELFEALQSEADHINDDIRFKLSDFFSKAPVFFLGNPVNRHLLHLAPGTALQKWSGFAPADIEYLIAHFHQHRNQIGSHLTLAADDDHSFHNAIPTFPGIVPVQTPQPNRPVCCIFSFRIAWKTGKLKSSQ